MESVEKDKTQSNAQSENKGKLNSINKLLPLSVISEIDCKKEEKKKEKTEEKDDSSEYEEEEGESDVCN